MIVQNHKRDGKQKDVTLFDKHLVTVSFYWYALVRICAVKILSNCHCLNTKETFFYGRSLKSEKPMKCERDWAQSEIASVSSAGRCTPLLRSDLR